MSDVESVQVGSSWPYYTPSSSASSEMLAFVSYKPALGVERSRNSTTFSDLDAADLVVTFTAPASGVVLVNLGGLAQGDGAGDYMCWNLRDGSGDIAGTNRMVTAVGSQYGHHQVGIRVAGLTPGAEYTWKWGAASSGTGVVKTAYGDFSGVFTGFPATMQVWGCL